MSTKKGLGKGLAALIPDPAATLEERPLEVSVSSLQPNPRQPRRRIDPEALSELARSMREQGVLQPLLVRKRGTGYEIVAGERRWRAAQEAGLEKVPVIIRDLSDDQVLMIALIENLQRQDLNALEEAMAFRELSRLQMSQEEIALRVGKSRPYVTNALRLLQLQPEIQRLVQGGTLTAGHARALLPLEGVAQTAAAREVVRRSLTVRQTEALVRKRLADPKRPARRTFRMGEWEDRLSRVLGTRTQILGTERRGRIVIRYTGREELGRILSQIGAGED